MPGGHDMVIGQNGAIPVFAAASSSVEDLRRKLRRVL
jgi:hypothetical protein